MSFDVRTEYQDVGVAEQYDRRRFSSLSGRVFQWAERRALEQIVAALPGDARILDAPCGTGRLMDIYLSRGLRVMGADISGEMIAVARRRTRHWSERARFSRMDFLQIPLRQGAVAAVFSIRFLPHISSAERVQMLREFRRVSSGWIVVSISMSTPWHRLRRRVKAWLGHPAPVRHPVTVAGLRAELQQAGLREVRRRWTFPMLSEQLVVVCERA